VDWGRFRQHDSEKNTFVDAIAERSQMLGGVSLAMAVDIAGDAARCVTEAVSPRAP